MSKDLLVNDHEAWWREFYTPLFGQDISEASAASMGDPTLAELCEVPLPLEKFKEKREFRIDGVATIVSNFLRKQSMEPCAEV